MDAESARLAAIAEQMDPAKRRDIQEVLANELQRRKEQAMNQGSAQTYGRAGLKANGVKPSRMSGGLDRESMGEVYSTIGRSVQEMRVKQLEEKLAEARALKLTKKEPVGGEPWFASAAFSLDGLKSFIGSGSGLLLVAVLIIGGMKVALSLQSETSTATTPKTQAPTLAAIDTNAAMSFAANGATTLPPAAIEAPGNWTHTDKELLTKLDERRVALEQRSTQLDNRERELEDQSKIIAERLAELRALSTKLAEVRREKDHLQEERMEQLAKVYSSMAPAEAANLIARIDDNIALALLQRMPGKRMGQVLALMPTDRAVQLTKSLTDKQKL